jgi:hypothetical protein
MGCWRFKMEKQTTLDEFEVSAEDTDEEDDEEEPEEDDWD